MVHSIPFSPCLYDPYTIIDYLANRKKRAFPNKMRYLPIEFCSFQFCENWKSERKSSARWLPREATHKHLAQRCIGSIFRVYSRIEKFVCTVLWLHFILFFSRAVIIQKWMIIIKKPGRIKSTKGKHGRGNKGGEIKLQSAAWLSDRCICLVY